MAPHDVAGLANRLREEYGDDLRWVTYYHSRRYSYQVEHVREDLRNELTDNQLDRIIHRSLAVYNKRHAEEVYFHLGEAGYLIVEYSRGTATHIFLDDHRGVTVMLEPDRSIELPAFVDWCVSILEGT